MKLVCRKCGGPHFTVKCNQGKEQNEINKNISSNSRTTYKCYNEVTKVKISDLPYNLTYNELNELLEEWGNISKLNIVSNSYGSTAYIDFKYKNDAEYFINALNNTIFDNQIIHINLV